MNFGVFGLRHNFLISSPDRFWKWNGKKPWELAWRKKKKKHTQDCNSNILNHTAESLKSLHRWLASYHQERLWMDDLVIFIGYFECCHPVVTGLYETPFVEYQWKKTLFWSVYKNLHYERLTNHRKIICIPDMPKQWFNTLNIQ